MEPDVSKPVQQQNHQPDIESLPPEFRKWCLSGKSVEDLAHLAKNILQVVSGSAEIIELGLETKRYDYVSRGWAVFEPNLKRLVKFVLDLVMYTRRCPLRKSACNLNSLVQCAIQDIEPLRKKYGITLRFSEDETIPSMQLDADRVVEMVSNLITHAIDNLPEHTGTIHIYTHSLPEHQQVQLSVADDGTPLTESVARSLDMPAERTRDMCGTGFDIPLAKLAIEDHNGYMEFESTPDTGNCVHVYLPME